MAREDDGANGNVGARLEPNDSQAGRFDLPASGAFASFDGGPDAAGAPHPFELHEDVRYHGAQVLAYGGMGRVSAVTDARLGRQVAKKEVLGGEGTASLERRLTQEAWITARLEHPGIVPIYNVGKDPQGRLFFTMRLIRGRSLATALADRNGAVPHAPHEANESSAALRFDRDLAHATLLRHFLAVCQAMAYAHAMGVIHRDLKPGNIMLGEFGETQIVDWGVARYIADDTADAANEGLPDEVTARTMFGTRVGTPAYMSPEQARAQPLGPASDVWSLGVVLFEIVSGRSFCEGITSDEIFARLDRGDLPRLEDIAPTASPELASIIARALAHAPAERYPDAKALAADIAAYLDGRRVDAHAYSAWQMARRFGRTFRVPLLIALAALVAIAVAVAVAYTQTLHERDLARAAEAAATAARDRAINAEQRAEDALVAADRSFANVLVQRAREAQRHGGQAEAEVLAAEALVRGPSPEARGVLAHYGMGSRVALVAVEPLPECNEARLSPDGTELLCLEADATSLWRVSPMTLSWRIPEHFAHAVFLDAASAVFVDTPRSPTTLLDVATGAVIPLDLKTDAQHVRAAAGVLFTQDGVQPVAWHHATNIATASDGPIYEPLAVSGDGRVAIIYDEGADLPWRIDLTNDMRGRAMAPLPFVGQGPMSAALDHDGRRAAFGGTKGELVVIAVADGRLLWRKGVTDRALTQVAWSPDGDFIAVRDERGWISLHDTLGQRRLALPRREVREMVWRSTSDGALELVTHGDALRIYRLPTEPRADEYAASAGISSLALDPTGATLALPDGRGAVRLYDVASGALKAELPGDDRGVAKSTAFTHDDGALVISRPGLFDLSRWSPDQATAVDLDSERMNYARVAAVRDGQLVLATYSDHLVRLARDGTREQIRPADGGGPIDLVATFDGNVVAWLSSRGGVDVKPMADPGRPARLALRDPGAIRIAIDGRGEHLAVAHPEDIRVFDLTTGEVERVLDIPGARIREVALARDGRRVAAGTIDGEVWVWDGDGAVSMIGAGHRERVSGLAFGPRGDWLVSAGWDGVARRWSLDSFGEPKDLASRLEARWGIDLDHATRVDLR